MFVLNILFFFVFMFRTVFEIVAVPERAEQTLRPSAEDSLDECLELLYEDSPSSLLRSE